MESTHALVALLLAPNVSMSPQDAVTKVPDETPPKKSPNAPVPHLADLEHKVGVAKAPCHSDQRTLLFRDQLVHLL